MFRFPNHTLKVKAPDQWQSAGEESLLTRDITYSDIKSTWPMKSSKEETDLSRDSKELFEQRFVKVFDKNRKYVKARNQTTGIPTSFTVPW